MSEAVIVKPALAANSDGIVSVLAANSADRGLYQKPRSAVLREIANFVVACNKYGKVIGCAGVWQESRELGEGYAVAVLPQFHRLGVARQLMTACLDRASAAGVCRLWLATERPDYFARYGFVPISPWKIPTRALLRKFRQTFHQPAERWIPALFGSHTFMLREAVPPSESPVVEGDKLFHQSP